MKESNRFVSGGQDNKILESEQCCSSYSQTIEANSKICDLSLNQMENKFIYCEWAPLLMIYELQQKDQQWVLAQKIPTIVMHIGYALQLEIKLLFNQKYCLEVYFYDNLEKQFHRLKEIFTQSCKKCAKGFPCQLIKQLNIITVKNGNFLNIYKLNQDRDFQMIQAIEFQYNDLNILNGRWMIMVNILSLGIHFFKRDLNQKIRIDPMIRFEIIIIEQRYFILLLQQSNFLNCIFFNFVLIDQFCNIQFNVKYIFVHKAEEAKKIWVNDFRQLGQEGQQSIRECRMGTEVEYQLLKRRIQFKFII